MTKIKNFILSNRKNLRIAGAAIVCVIIILIVALNKKSSSGPGAPGNQTSVQAVLTAPSSTAQNTSSTNASTATGTSPISVASRPPVTSVPPPSLQPTTYPTCTPDLTFGVASGNPAGTGSVNYTLTAKNIGETACQSPSISVYYDDGETFVSASPAATSKGYYWKLGDLAPGQAITISLATNRSIILSPGDDTSEACLSANNGSDSCANAGTPGNVGTQTAAGSSGGAQTASANAVPEFQVPSLTAFPIISGHEIGVWEWTPLSQMSQATMEQVVDEAANNHFNVIYQTIDEYLTIDELPDGAAKQSQLATYEASVNQFLTLAAAKGIAVDAEAGAQDWAEAGNTWEPSDIINFVAAYNQSHATKFRGIQYDIEPYLLAAYNNNRVGVLTDYVQLVQSLASQDKNTGLPLTIIVPDFYDGSPAKTPEITLNGSTNYPYTYILQSLSALPNARIIVMAYDNTADGAGGSISLSQNEVQLADTTNVKVIVAQETGPVTPSYVTFAGLSRDDLFSQVGAIGEAFSSDKSFGGIAVDYLDPYLDLQ